MNILILDVKLKAGTFLLKNSFNSIYKVPIEISGPQTSSTLEICLSVLELEATVLF